MLSKFKKWFKRNKKISNEITIKIPTSKSNTIFITSAGGGGGGISKADDNNEPKKILGVNIK
jgi:hypothetical protein